MKLHVFLFDPICGSPDHERLKGSLFSIDCDFIKVESINDVNDFPKKNWFLLLRTNEYLQNSLTEAIPLYTKSQEYVCFSFFKTEGIDKFSLCPRLFHPSIKIDSNWNPIDLDKYLITNALDGWIFQ